jgi:Ca2+-binding EF-hand superfamily protein
MRLKTLVAVAVAAALAVPLSTYAQADKPSKAPSAGAFQSADKDNDGSVSREEAKGTPLEKDFDKLDKDNDGKLSASEAAGAGAGVGGTAPSGAEPKKQ